MSVSGLCEICQRPDVDHTCDRCGQLVCDRHYDEETGFCVDCTAEVGRPDSPNQPPEEDLPDGVDTYSFIRRTVVPDLAGFAPPAETIT